MNLKYTQTHSRVSHSHCQVPPFYVNCLSDRKTFLLCCSFQIFLYFFLFFWDVAWGHLWNMHEKWPLRLYMSVCVCVCVNWRIVWQLTSSFFWLVCLSVLHPAALFMCLPNYCVFLLFFGFFLALGLKVVGNKAKMNLDGLNGLRNRKILCIFNNHPQKALRNICKIQQVKPKFIRDEIRI